MPALRMKAKEITRLSEGHSLAVCHKPMKAFNNSNCRIEASLLAGIVDTSQDSHDVISHSGSTDKSRKLPGVVEPRDFSDGLSVQNSDFSLESAGAICEVLQSMQTLETIFSPVIQLNGSKIKSINNTDSYDVNTGLPRLIDDSDDGRCSAKDFPSSELLNNFTLDFNPFFPHNGGIGFSDLINISSPEYDHISSGLTLDINCGCMIFPSFEKKLDAVYEDASDNNRLPTLDQSVMYLAISQLRQPDRGTDNNLYIRESKDFDCFCPQLFLDNLPDAPEAISPLQPSVLGNETRKKQLVTLVLDLDETLVHSCLEHCDGADFTFSIHLNNEDFTVYVRQRPYLNAFLERVAQMFEVVIFTASQSIYAAQLLDKLDPNKNLISKRIYRESCTFSGDSYTKDLTILGIDLAKVAIIDNSPQVFQLQVNNGIPIKSWFDDPTDCALISLLPFLETLVDADDVRPLIMNFNNREQ